MSSKQHPTLYRPLLILPHKSTLILLQSHGLRLASSSMNGILLLVSTLLASANAWTYPDCERDSCYRNLIDRRYADGAPAFCLDWNSGLNTAVSVVPSRFRNCPDIAAVSSACSCVAYTATHASTTPRMTSTTPIGCNTESSMLTSTLTSPTSPTDYTSETATTSVSASSTSHTFSVSSSTESSVTQQTHSTVFTTLTRTVTNCL